MPVKNCIPIILFDPEAPESQRSNVERRLNTLSGCHSSELPQQWGKQCFAMQVLHWLATFFWAGIQTIQCTELQSGFSNLHIVHCCASLFALGLEVEVSCRGGGGLPWEVDINHLQTRFCTRSPLWLWVDHHHHTNAAFSSPFFILAQIWQLLSIPQNPQIQSKSDDGCI